MTKNGPFNNVIVHIINDIACFEKVFPWSFGMFCYGIRNTALDKTCPFFAPCVPANPKTSYEILDSSDDRMPGIHHVR